VNKFLANAIRIFRGWPLPIKIVISLVALIAILEQGSRFQFWRFQQNTKTNTTPHKQSVDVTKVPQEVKAFLSDENLQKMDEAGMNIYTGDNPPNIEGTYVFKDVVIKYDPDGANFPLVTYYFTFKDQSSKTVNFSYSSEKGSDGLQDLAEGRGVFISGDGNCFSAYIDNDETTGECKFKSAQIISACKEEKGLVDMDNGTLWTYRGDKCSETDYVAPGHLRIFSHKSLAPRK